MESIDGRIERLEKELAELKADTKPKVDNRVDFGMEVVFNTYYSRADGSFSPACIGHGLSKRGDTCKVLIARPGYRWEIHEDYYGIQNAVSLHKI